MSGLGLHNNDHIRDRIMLVVFLLIILAIAVPRFQALRAASRAAHSDVAASASPR